MFPAVEPAKAFRFITKGNLFLLIQSPKYEKISVRAKSCLSKTCTVGLTEGQNRLQQRQGRMNKSSAVEPKLSPWQQGFYRYFLPIQTRVKDTDWFGHVNNVTYYSYFDTVINHYLIRRCGLRHPRKDTQEPNISGYMVDTRCTYRHPINYPGAVLAGVTVTKLGNSSVTYTVGLFAERAAGEETERHTGRMPSQAGDLLESHQSACFGSHQDAACAVGQCVHVFVDINGDQRPVYIPDSLRIPLQKIHVPFDSESSKL